MSKGKPRLVFDKEQIELLHADPELLTIADAIGATTQSPERRPLRSRVSRCWRLRRRRC